MAEAPLQLQQVEVRLGKLDVKTSDKLAMPGTMAVVQDAEVINTGRYQRRPGTRYLANLTGAVRLHAGEREFLAGTTDQLYSRYAGTFQARGAVAGYKSDFTPVNNTPFQQTGHDFVRAGGLDWSVWAEAGGIFYAARDSSTGAYTVAEGIVTTAATRVRPMILATSTHVIIVYYDSGGNSIYARRITIAAPAVVGGETFVDTGGGSVGQSYDIVNKSGNVICLARSIGSAGAAVTVKLLEWDVSTMAVTATTTTATLYTMGSSHADGSTLITGFVQGGAGGYVVLHAKKGHTAHALNDNSRVRAVTAPAGLASSASVVIFDGTTSATDEFFYNVTGFVDGAGTWHLLGDLASTAASARSQVFYWTRTSGGALAGPNILFGVRLASRPMSFGGRDLMVLSGSVQTVAGPDSTLFLTEVQTGLVVGRALAGRAQEKTALFGHLPHGLVTADAILAPTQYFITTTQLAACVVDFSVQPDARYIEVAGVTLIPGSTIHLYDGIGVSELGFHFPPGISAVVAAAAGGLGTGNYFYRSHWEWVDGVGRLHRSAPSDPVTLAATAGQRGRVTIGTLVNTLKRPPIPGAVVKLSRTTVNPTSASAFFVVATVANDPTTASFIIDDTLGDATIVTMERLYTLGNTVLANAMPPPANALSVWADRVWACERDVLWFSKTIADGEGVAFPVENFLQISDDRGDLVTAADAGLRLAIFKNTGIYVVSGEGPDNTGAGSFSQVKRLPVPLGARSAVSVISTELGVFFQDDESGHIWLLPPDGLPTPIGREVESLTAALDIVDAVVVSDKRQVRFFTSQGTTLVYDLTHQHWSSFTQQQARAAAVVGGVCHYLNVSSEINFDDPTVWVEGLGGPITPGGTFYFEALETDWLSFAQIGGYQRTFACQATGSLFGAHTVRITLRYRFGTATDVADVQSSDLSVAAFGYRIEARPKLNRQAATAIKVRIEDASAHSTAGFGLESLSFTVGLRSKRERLARKHIGTPQ